MVVLHYKKTDLNQFLYETYSEVKIDDLISEVCESKLNSLFMTAKLTKTCFLSLSFLNKAC